MHIRLKSSALLAALALAGCGSEENSGPEQVANTAPQITSEAVATASVNTSYSYTVLASDADGDSTLLSATTIPGWLNFDSISGILSGTPGDGDVGNHTIMLTVSDGSEQTTQSYTLTVNAADSSNSPENTAPVITSTALLTADQGRSYSYALIADDADNDELTLTATTIPSWLSFDPASGILSGTPGEDEVGNHTISLMASDGTEQVSQDFTITVTPPQTGGDWSLVWNDEFDGADIDLTKWEHEVNCSGGGNNEKQCYTNAPENSYLEDGKLKIVALQASGQSLPYSSARLRTKYQGDWTYGKVEVRAIIPSGQGSFPAIWMLPTDNVYGGWPHSGEIDIFESVNLKVNGENKVHGNLWYGRSWPNQSNTGAEYELPDHQNPADDFHTYAIEWEEGEIRWYVDGVLYQTQLMSEVTLNANGDPDGLIYKGWFTQANGTDLWDTAPFDQDFHLLINFAVGGNWAENVNNTGIDPSAFHASNAFEVEYVRVYECSADPVTGKGCATVTPNYLDPIEQGGTLVEGAAPTPIPPASETGSEDITIFADDFNENWVSFGAASTVEADDAEHGQVVEFSFGASPTIAGFSTLESDSPTPYDASGYLENGLLEFDLKLISAPVATDSWYIKVEQGDQSSEAVVSMDTPTVGEWVHYSVPLQTLNNAGVELNGIDAIMMFPAWSLSEGAVFRVDNVTITGTNVAPCTGDDCVCTQDCECTGDDCPPEPSGETFNFISSTGESGIDFGVAVVNEWSTGTTIGETNHNGVNAWELTSSTNSPEAGNWGTVLAYAGGIYGDFSEHTTLRVKVATTGSYSRYAVAIGANGVTSEVTIPVDDSNPDWQDVNVDLALFDLNLSSIDQIAIFGVGGTAGSSKIYIADLAFDADQSIVVDSVLEDDYVFISANANLTPDLIDVDWGEWSTGTGIANTNYNGLNAIELSANGSWGAVLALAGKTPGGTSVENFGIDYADYTNLKLKVASSGEFDRYAVHIGSQIGDTYVGQDVDFGLAEPSEWNDIDINLAKYGVNLSNVSQIAVFGVYADGVSASQKLYITDLTLYDNGVATQKPSDDDKFVFISSTGELVDTVFDGNDLAHDGNTTINEWSTGTQLQADVTYDGLSAFELTKGDGWGAVLAYAGDISGGVLEYDLDVAQYSTINLKVATQGSFESVEIAFVTDGAEVKYPLTGVNSSWTNFSFNTADLPVNVSKLTQMAIYGIGGGAGNKIYVTDFNITK